MFFKNILLGRVQRTLEYVLKLNECANVVEFDFVCPFIKVGYCLIDGEFNSIKSTVLVDFDFVFVIRIRASSFVNLGEDSFFIPHLLQFEERWLFINARHFWLCRTLVLVVFASFLRFQAR